MVGATSERLRFGRLLADYAYELINSYRVRVTSLAALVNVYGDRKNYALYELAGDGVDTVGVWGSNPHAPTIFLNNLALATPFSVAPKKLQSK